MPFVWKSQSAAEKLEKRKAGLVKRYGSVSVLNQIVPSLSINSAPIQNTITIKTFGGTVVKLQSTHPRGGVRYFLFLLLNYLSQTSIHAPAGGAIKPVPWSSTY